MRVVSAQPYSASREAGNAGMKQGGKFRADVLVGVTPAGFQEPQTAHFCSSKFVVTQTLVAGVTLVEERDNYGVVFKDGMYRIAKPALVFANALVEVNGRLVVSDIRNARAVIIPDSVEGAPWAHSRGPGQVLSAYGVATMEELFRRYSYALAS